MKRIFQVSLLMLFILTCFRAVGEEKTMPRDPMSILETTKNLSIEDFEKAMLEIRHHRDSVISRLIELLSTEKSEEKKVRICYILGEHRNPSAIPILINNLLLKSEIDDPYTKLPLWGPYPAQQALMKIGHKAIPEMIKILKDSNEEKRRELACGVISEVLTPDIARFRIQRDAEKEPDEQKKANLLSALKYLPKPKD